MENMYYYYKSMKTWEHPEDMIFIIIILFIYEIFNQYILFEDALTEVPIDG